jgi:hypothetical protein
LGIRIYRTHDISEAFCIAILIAAVLSLAVGICFAYYDCNDENGCSVAESDPGLIGEVIETPEAIQDIKQMNSNVLLCENQCLRMDAEAYDLTNNGDCFCYTNGTVLNPVPADLIPLR